MCGILLNISRVDKHYPNPNELPTRLIHDVHNRGPDSLQTIETVRNSLRLRFTASVLSLRGSTVVSQPLAAYSDDGQLKYALCWNGEAWRFDGNEFGADENDSLVIFHHLTHSNGRIPEILQKIEGPFAVVFYDGPNDRVWFGRDWLGRRSLLIKNDKKDVAGAHITICSVSDRQDNSAWTEVEADGFYYLNISGSNESSDLNQDPVRLSFGHIRYVPQNTLDDMSQALQNSSEMPLPIPPLQRKLPETQPTGLTPESEPVQLLYHLLHDSLRLRIRNIPTQRVPIEPDHVDSARPARVGILFSGGIDCTIIARIAHDVLPLEEPIDLINVAFENRRVIDAEAAAHAKQRRKSQNSVEGGSVKYYDADNTYIYELCPDRKTGRQSFQELKQVCLGRDFRFREINVAYDDVLEQRSNVIALLYPHDTEMDLSIGLAFYFASKPLELDSPRILLSGLGADELFAGYGRHGVAFQKNGYEGLLNELELDLGRLGKRNLGRDDRIIANWAREVRFPFLDERLLSEVVAWEVNDKCGFGAPQSGGEWEPLDNEKRVLRLLAWKLGLTNVAREKKRAIQFGARTAKMEKMSGGKVKGTQKIKVKFEE